MGQPIKMGTGLFDIIDTTKTDIRESSSLETGEEDEESLTTLQEVVEDDRRSIFSQRSQKAQTALETSVKDSPSKKRVKFAV
jgi:hypothetical protein